MKKRTPFQLKEKSLSGTSFVSFLASSSNVSLLYAATPFFHNGVVINAVAATNGLKIVLVSFVPGNFCDVNLRLAPSDGWVVSAHYFLRIISATCSASGSGMVTLLIFSFL